MRDSQKSEETSGAGCRQAVALTIAGSDSGGNAGIQADLRAFHVFGVRSILTADAAFVGDQLDAVLEAYDVRALKTGMLAAPDVIEAVADRLLLQSRISKVFDPVMVATSGAKLLQDEAISLLKGRLLPLATLITPNLPEAEVLLGRAVATRDDMAAAARELADAYGCAVLIKGGHGTGVCAEDVLFDGTSLCRLATPRIENPLSTHGTGCSLSAAIAAALACGKTLVDAVVEGKAYVYEAIRTGVQVGEAAAVLGTPKRLPLDCVTVQPLNPEL